VSKPWGEEEKFQWLEKQKIKRSYKDEVLSKLQDLESKYEVQRYGALSYDPERYPLFLVKNKSLDPDKKTVLITGGVHGYETSGVQGALAFLEREGEEYSKHFNIVCVPCISPWGYETINRWNPLTVDPNRSFNKNSPAEECESFLKAIDDLGVEIYAHFDLHETTDTDNTVFRPALEKRDGVPQAVWDIPDGFYLVGNTESPKHEFQKAIIESVKEVTHIAPSDENGKIIGEPLSQEGVINYDIKSLNLCAGFSNAEYTTTTEVYPDSPKATDEVCIDAQVAAVKGGLEFLKGL
tara:strand:- start:108808 stop:109692 length:885 start_codon:yes stop_codon:yes gene_type:complete